MRPQWLQSKMGKRVIILAAGPAHGAAAAERTYTQQEGTRHLKTRDKHSARGHQAFEDTGLALSKSPQSI